MRTSARFKRGETRGDSQIVSSYVFKKGGTEMSYECEIREQPAQPVLSIRTRSSAENLPKVLGESYLAVADYLRELKEKAVGPPFCGTGTIQARILAAKLTGSMGIRDMS